MEIACWIRNQRVAETQFQNSMESVVPVLALRSASSLLRGADCERTNQPEFLVDWHTTSQSKQYTVDGCRLTVKTDDCCCRVDFGVFVAYSTYKDGFRWRKDRISKVGIKFLATDRR